MRKKEYRKQMEFIQGYRQGYFHRNALHTDQIRAKSEPYKRGYYEARRDLKDGEQPLY